MHPFLKKSLAFLLLLVGVAVAVIWMIITAARASLHTEVYQQSVELHIQQLHLDLLEKNVKLWQQWINLAQDDDIVNALDRETPANALQHVLDVMKRGSFEPDYVGFFDFDHDPLISNLDQMRSLDQQIGRYFKSRHQTRDSHLIFIDDQLLHLVFLQIGFADRPAGFLAIGQKWQAHILPLTDQELDKSWQLLRPSKDDDLQAWRVLKSKPSWQYEMLQDEELIHIRLRLPVIQQVAPVVVQFSLEQQQLFHSPRYFIWMASAITVLLAFLGLGLVTFLHYETFLPLEKLFLFITMLRDRNRFQKKPDFAAFPLFRRIANEVLAYLDLIDLEKKEWQKKYYERQNKIACTEELNKLNACEMRIWLKISSQLMRELFSSFQQLREKQLQVKDLGAIFSLIKTIHQYQMTFSLHQMTNLLSKTNAALHHLGPKNRQLSQDDWDRLEGLVFEILEELELCHKIIVEWFGLPDEQFRFLMRPGVDWFARLQSAMLESESLPRQVNLSTAIENLLAELEDVKWLDCQQRLSNYCSEYAQIYGKFPLKLQVIVPSDMATIKWQTLLVVYPFLVETIGMLIEFSIEERWERVQRKKAELAIISVKFSEQKDEIKIDCWDDGRHLPIKTALAKMVPSGGFKLDEIDENQCWDLLNKIHLHDFVREHQQAPADELEFLIYLMKRFRQMGLKVEAKGHQEGGLRLSVKIMKHQYLPTGTKDNQPAERRA